MNLYPAIDLKDGQCVRLMQGRFDEVTNYGNDPLLVAQRWQAEGARWLHIVDLDGARTGASNANNLKAVERIVRHTGLPVQLGGGMRDAETVARMLNLGVARVVLGTAAVRDPDFAQAMFREYADRIAIGVDARDGLVAVQGWQQSTTETATAFVARMAELGAKRFIFTDIARDGMLQGVNLVSLAQVAAAVPDALVIASGGVATLADIEALIKLRAEFASNLEGVIIGKALYAGTLTLPEALALISQ